MVKCPDCGKELSDHAFICPNCGYDMDKYLKQQRKLQKEQKTMEDWNNLTPAQKQNGLIALAVIVILIVIGIMVFFVNNTDHNDGKCDICDKKKYETLNGEEYCYEHWKDAIDYYLDD